MKRQRETRLRHAVNVVRRKVIDAMKNCKTTDERDSWFSSSIRFTCPQFICNDFYTIPCLVELITGSTTLTDNLKLPVEHSAQRRRQSNDMKEYEKIQNISRSILIYIVIASLPSSPDGN